jgi:DNA-binding LacI/PurR family transcriptional regulator
LKLKPDGVVFAPFYKKEATEFINQLKELNIPFVFIDSEIKECRANWIHRTEFISKRIGFRKAA